ncbi:hypothetical protein Mapa_012247 [Marchantia paleacea]|nr:hypothetical protein Mapa_012247 [Marchantia paleacea]
MARMRPVFCGNFEYDARQSEIERMFTKYGKVERVDMKTGGSTELGCSLFAPSVHANSCSTVRASTSNKTCRGHQLHPLIIFRSSFLSYLPLSSEWSCQHLACPRDHVDHVCGRII